MPTVHFGKRAGRTRRSGTESRATADGLVSVSVSSGGTTEVGDAQTVTLTNAYGGNFTLTDGTSTTGNIAWNASAGTVETAIETFTSVTSATVTGSDGGPWTITLNDDAGPVDDYVGAAAGLTVRSVVITEAVKGVANTYQVTSV